jgi:hypothetical protein
MKRQSNPGGVGSSSDLKFITANFDPEMLQ